MIVVLMIENILSGVRNAPIDVDVRKKGADIGHDAVCIAALNDGFAFIRIFNEGMCETAHLLGISSEDLMLRICQLQHEMPHGLGATAARNFADSHCLSCGMGHDMNPSRSEGRAKRPPRADQEVSSVDGNVKLKLFTMIWTVGIRTSTLSSPASTVFI